MNIYKALYDTMGDGEFHFKGQFNRNLIVRRITEYQVLQVVLMRDNDNTAINFFVGLDGKIKATLDQDGNKNQHGGAGIIVENAIKQTFKYSKERNALFVEHLDKVVVNI